MRRRPPRSAGPDLLAGAFLRSVRLERERVASFEQYPFSVPAVRGLHSLDFHPKVTFFVGENGTGKSTLIEALAIAAGFNPEGGSKNFNFATNRTESELHQALRLIRSPRRERDGFFLRAESFYNVATEVENLSRAGEEPIWGYGPRSLHAQSHGESFMALALNRFRGLGLYIMDEPEAALSPSRQLALLSLIHLQVTQGRSQFVIATHSPILMAYPDATIYNLSPEGEIQPIAYEQTEHYRVTLDFLTNRDSYLRHLLADPESDD
jgi:predicted ATPase